MDEVQEYIDRFEEPVRSRLIEIREQVRKLAPDASERICMGIPTFDLNGKWLIHFAGYKKHIGFYPDPVTIEAFQDRLKEYKTSKGAVQFPLNAPLPLDLIRAMTEYRIGTLKSSEKREES